MPKPLRYLVNLLIKAMILWAFSALGWITIRPAGWQGMAIAIVAIFMIGGALSLPVFALRKIPLLGVPLLAVTLVSVGYVTLWLLDRFAEEFFQLNVGFWKTLLLGLLLTFVSIPSTSEKTQKTHAALLRVLKK